MHSEIYLSFLTFIRHSFQRKALDANRYATKKTIAQGLLDVALLTANASQLKYVLQVGADNHPFYYLMLSLIIISMILQVSSFDGILNIPQIKNALSHILRNATTTFVRSVARQATMRIGYTTLHPEFISYHVKTHKEAIT